MSEEKKHDVDYTDPNEEAKVQTGGLSDVAVVKGTEDEEPIFRNRVKLFRFRDNQWKERGVGNARLMRNKTNKMVRLVMRQEKTLKPIANFNLAGDGQCELTAMANNEKAWTWGCNDFSDEAGGQLEKLCMKFNNKTAADEFKAAFDAGVQFNKDVKEGKDATEAAVIEDVEDVRADNIDVNESADKDGE